RPVGRAHLFGDRPAWILGRPLRVSSSVPTLCARAGLGVESTEHPPVRRRHVLNLALAGLHSHLGASSNRRGCADSSHRVGMGGVSLQSCQLCVSFASHGIPIPCPVVPLVVLGLDRPPSPGRTCFCTVHSHSQPGVLGRPRGGAVYSPSQQAGRSPEALSACRRPNRALGVRLTPLRTTGQRSCSGLRPRSTAMVARRFTSFRARDILVRKSLAVPGSVFVAKPCILPGAWSGDRSVASQASAIGSLRSAIAGHPARTG